MCSFFFFFNDTATTEIYTLSLHDALPIYVVDLVWIVGAPRGHDAHVTLGFLGLDLGVRIGNREDDGIPGQDRKSTRLNSSHSQISYAVFCLKKKKTQLRPRLALLHTP